MNRIPALLWLGALAGGGALACTESTGGGQIIKPPDQLTNLRFAAGAPALCNDSAGGWVIKDAGETEFALTFPEAGEIDCQGGTEDFVRLRIKHPALFKLPDGSLIPPGDSVFVYVKWVGGDSVTVELQPSGLLFDPAENPPVLKIDYSVAGPDFNEDGNVDQDDDRVEQEIDVWRQENPGDDFVKLDGSKVEIDDEIEVKLNGFSRYAISY